MRNLVIAASGVFMLLAAPVQAVEGFQCVTVQQANEMLEENGDTIVAHMQRPGLLMFLVQRKDGSYKEVVVDATGRACHTQDFIGDPRKPGAAL